MQKLSIGIQNFEKIREGNYLYVDKTIYYFSSFYYFKKLSLPTRPNFYDSSDYIDEDFEENEEDYYDD